MPPVLRQLIYSHLALAEKFQMISLTFAFMVYIMLTRLIGSATFNLPLTPASAAIYGFISSSSYCASVSAACRLSCSFPLRSKRLYIIVIFSGSEKQDAAFRFVQFMLSEEVQLELLKVGVIPTLKSCVDSKAVQADSKWSVYMKQLESAQSRIPTPQASTVEQLWQDAMTEIFIEGADVQSTLTSYAAEIDLELAK